MKQWRSITQVRTVGDMKEVIIEAMEDLDSYQPIFTIYCAVLRVRRIPYSRIRTAVIDENRRQLRLFEPGKRGRP